jgi:CPA2 family monovalent cation:H+ antiporter-2
VLRRIRTVREARYGLFRGYFHGATDHAESPEDAQPRLHSVVIVDGSAAIGKRPEDIAVAPAAISSVRRGGHRLVPEDEDEAALRSGDIVVVFGTPSSIALAEQALLAGG